MSQKLHNPKSYSPAVYIPCWLSQVPNNELSYSSKLVYGRLAQWATNQGKAHRSARQLSAELGMPERTVEKCLKELREAKLIGSFILKEGGHNHFEFYDHEFMHREVNQNLCYTNNIFTPSADIAVPSADIAVPSADIAVHKIKEIKKNNSHTEDDFLLEKNLYIESEQLRKACVFRKQCLENEKCKSKYMNLPGEVRRDKEFKDILDECISHYATQQNPKLVSPQRFLSWINREIKYYLTQKQITEKSKPIDSYVKAQQRRYDEQVQQARKDEQMAQEAKIYRGIKKAVANGRSSVPKEFKDLAKKLKGESDVTE